MHATDAGPVSGLSAIAIYRACAIPSPAGTAVFNASISSPAANGIERSSFQSQENAEKFADDNDLEGKLETGKSKAKEALSKARNATQALGESVSRAKEKNPDEYELAVIDYNLAYSEMNASGNNLLLSREKSVELIGYVTRLVNSIANTPKSFEQDFEEIRIAKAEFSDASEYAEKELQAARNSAASAASGVTAGIAVASLAPSAAMWVATTFGTASTGAAISTLSGAAATNAALAWLGGGALAAGGTGMAGGSAFLALAGPVGWTSRVRRCSRPSYCLRKRSTISMRKTW